MENSTRTIYGGFIQTCLWLGVPPTYKPHSTLNEKFAINASILPSTSDIPTLSYYAIGNGGHQMVIGAEGIAVPEPIQHRGTDAALFKHLPFVLRATNDDLSPSQRARYALRRLETHNSIQYIAYYLRRIDKTNLVPVMEYKVVSNGETTTTAFTPNTSNLNPTPPDVSNTGVNTVDGDYTSASARLNLVMTEDEISELLNVANVIHSSTSFAIISEIALCTGVDKVVTVNASGGGTFQFNEAIGVQIATHMPAFVPAKYSNTGATLAVDVGATEPLFTITAP